MEYILDFQGFKSKDNDYIVKELAIISTDGQIYELQLFQPPCDFDKLDDSVKKQVIWLEKHYHGFYWGSGFREYKDLTEVFKSLNFNKRVYVKGTEKKTFISKLLLDYNVDVVNVEDLGCPSFTVLKQQTPVNVLKPCSFNHNSINCAYLNAQLMLQWWKTEQQVLNRLEKVNLAIKDCQTKGFGYMDSDLVKYLPKEFILQHDEDIEMIFDKLPTHLQCDTDILSNMRCHEHYQFSFYTDKYDGPNPKKKNCYFCSHKLMMLRNKKDNTTKGQRLRSKSI